MIRISYVIISPLRLMQHDHVLDVLQHQLLLDDYHLLNDLK